MECSSFPFWPIPVFWGCTGLAWVLWVAGLIFSVVMVVDCLKRAKNEFHNPLTKEGEYDKLIWAGAIILSFGFYFLGAIVYFFVVKKNKQASSE